MRANWVKAATAVALAGCGEPNQSPPNYSPTVAPSAERVASEQPSHPGDASYKNIDFERALSDLKGAGSAPTAEAPSALTPAQIAAQASKSVVVIRTPLGTGAGFVVAPNRVATCFHVVAGADRIVVRTQDGVEHAVYSVVAYDQTDDVALLAVEAVAAPPLRLGDFTAVSPGDPVTVIGHPEGLESSVSTGIVSAVRKLDSGSQLLQITAPISPGSSGGPVLNQKGRVIGLTSFLLRNGQELNFAAPIPALRKLLASESAPIPLAQFAQMTAVKTEPQVTATSASATQPAPAHPPFPASVAGFSFGMTLEQAQFACATADNQAASRRGFLWYTSLQVDGVRAGCPFAPEPLDFVKSVALQFAAGQVVRITLFATTLGVARDRFSSKYGVPRQCQVAGKWVPGNLAIRPGETGCYWILDGGTVYFFEDRTPSVVYVSDAEKRLQQQGF